MTVLPFLVPELGAGTNVIGLMKEVPWATR